MNWSLGGFELATPWYLLLVPLGVAILFLRRGGWISFHALSHPLARSWRTRLLVFAPVAAMFFALLSALLGAAGLGGRYVTRTSQEEPAGRIIVNVDQSGSMFGGYSSGQPLTCVFEDEIALIERYRNYDLSGEIPSTGNASTDRELKRAWIKAQSLEHLDRNLRIKGACRAIEALLDGLEARAVRTVRPIRHEVAFLRFASSSALQDPLTTNYAHLRDIVSRHDWGDAGRTVGGSTNIPAAIYDMLYVALRKNVDGEDGVVKIPSEVANAMLGSAVISPKNDGEVAALVAENSELFAALSAEQENTSIVLITDATGIGSMWGESPSILKMLMLARELRIPVYVISTEEENKELRAAVEATGTSEHPGGYFTVNKLDGYTSMDEIMKTILDRAFTRAKSVNKTERDTFADYCALAAFLFVCLWLVLIAGPSRSLTN